MVILLMFWSKNMKACDPPNGFWPIGSEYNVFKISELGFPGNQFTNMTFHLSGVLEIDGNASFKNCQILINEGSSILVTGNSLKTTHGLALYNTHLSSCDDGMWWGIIMGDDKSITVINSSINHANRAISLGYRNLIAIEGSIFEDNYIGLFAPSIPNNAITIRYLTKNTFRTNVGLKEPHGSMQTTNDERGLAGIYVEDVVFFHIGTIGGEEYVLDQDNVFRNLHSGIVGKNTSLRVRNSRFKDIWDVDINSTGQDLLLDNAISANGISGSFFVDVRGKGINFLNFDNCQRGIFTQHITDFSLVNNYINAGKAGLVNLFAKNGNYTVENNKFIVDHIAISQLNNPVAKSIKIRDNYISLSDMGSNITSSDIIRHIAGPDEGLDISDNTIFLDPNILDNQFALNISNTYVSKVDNNYFENINAFSSIKDVRYLSFEMAPFSNVTENVIVGLSDDVGSSKSHGIGLSFSSGSNVFCNSIENTPQAIYLAGNNDMSPISNNYFNDNSEGLVYSQFSSNAPQQVNVANQWTGSNYQWAARCDIEDQSITFFSGFLVHDDEMPWFPDPLLVVAGDWFYYDSGLSEPNALCPDPAGLADPNKDNYFNLVIEDYPQVEFQEGQQYWAQWNLYGALRHDTTVTTNANIISWFQSTQSGSMGQLYDISTTIRNSKHLFPQVSSKLDSNMIVQCNLVDQYLEIIEDYQTTPDSLWSAIDSLLIPVIDSLILNDIDSRLLTYELDSLLLIKHNYLISTIDNLDIFSPIDSFIASVLKVELSATFLRVDTFTISQRTLLEDIADHCVYAFGPGVLMARNLLRSINPDMRWDSDQNCIPIAEVVSSNTPFSDTGIKIYPNPSSDYIEISSIESIILQVNIINAFGQAVQSVSGFNGYQTVIDISSLHTGIYWIQMIYPDGKVYTRKLIKN